MRLSLAIRLGAMLRPQGFGSYFSNGGSCAMGAAIEAAGFSKDTVPEWRNNPFRVFSETHLTDCPICTETNYFTIVSHLNDDHKWTRERIADWVESVEPAPVAIPPLAVERVEVSHGH